MDKYQKFMLSDGVQSCRLVEKTFKSKLSGRQDCGEIDFEKGVIMINQDEDITSTVYETDLYCSGGVSGVSVRRGEGEWGMLGANDRGAFTLTLDFNDRITEVALSFAGGLADDLVLKVVYNEADKEKYYKKKAAEDMQKLIDNAKIDVQACAHVLSVYFAPCREDYGSTEISLYRDGTQFLADYCSSPKVFSIVVTGLGNGDYSFILRQKDKAGNVIIETQKIGFKMKDSYIHRSGGGLPSC